MDDGGGIKETRKTFIPPLKGVRGMFKKDFC
jgi:hypothetical protein